MKALCLLSFAFIVATASPQVARGAEERLSLQCQDIPFSECLNKLSQISKKPLASTPPVTSRNVSVALSDVTLRNAIGRLVDAASLDNYTVRADAKTGGLTIQFLALPAALQNAPQAAAGTPQAQPAGPEASSYDTPLAQGGPTPRQLDDMMRKQEAAAIDLDAPLGLGEVDGKPVTLRMIQEIQANSPPPPKVVVTPDMNITEEELEKTLERNAKIPVDPDALPEIGKDAGAPPSIAEVRKNEKAAQDFIEKTRQMSPEETIKLMYPQETSGKNP